MSWIEDQFPAIDTNGLLVTSPKTEDYNCIAWAANENDAWWSHLPGYRWPVELRSPLIESLIAAYTSIGFEVCGEDSPEPGYEKVALYARNDLWTHAARQLPDGKWTSKLGPEEDISHKSPSCLEGMAYGNVHCIMRRPIGGEEATQPKE